MLDNRGGRLYYAELKVVLNFLSVKSCRLLGWDTSLSHCEVQMVSGLISLARGAACQTGAGLEFGKSLQFEFALLNQSTKLFAQPRI